MKRERPTGGKWRLNGNQLIADTRDCEGRHETWIADIFVENGSWRANARLLLAAPALLKALTAQTKAVQAVIDKWEQGDLAAAVRALDACRVTSREAIRSATVDAGRFVEEW